MYMDNDKFTIDKVIKLRDVFLKYNIVYAIIFGSYISRKNEIYRDIDIGVYYADESNYYCIPTEDISIEIENIVDFKVDLVPLCKCDNIFLHGVIDFNNVLFKNNEYTKIINNKIHEMSLWCEFNEGRDRYLVGRSICKDWSLVSEVEI